MRAISEPCCRKPSLRQRLEKYPDDFNANYNLGDALLNKGDAAGAIPYFQAAFKANPGSVVAATELGVALFSASKLEEAEEQFKAALAIAPGYTDARFDLASVESCPRPVGGGGQRIPAGAEGASRRYSKTSAALGRRAVSVGR